MDIRCERCQAEYDFDESSLPEAGLPVKCSACGNVFKVMKRSTASMAPPPPQGGVQLRRGGQVIAVAPDLPTVAQWISERRLLPDDEFSAMGTPFRRFAELPEWARLFGPALTAPPPALGAPPPAMAGPSVPPPSRPSRPAMPSVPPPGRGFTNPSIPPLGNGGPSQMPFRVPAENKAPKGSGSFPAAGVEPPIDDDAARLREMLAGFGAPDEAPKQAGSGSFRAVSTPAGDDGDAAQLRQLLAEVPVNEPALEPSSDSAELLDIDWGEQPVLGEWGMPTESARTSAPFDEPIPRRTGQSSAATRVADDDEDEPARRTWLWATLAVGVSGVALAAAVWFVPPLHEAASRLMKYKPPVEAVSALEKGRQAYLSDTMAKFPDAELYFARALEIAGKQKYAQAHGALAELRCAWAEKLASEQARREAEAKEKAAAGLSEADELAEKAAHAATEVKQRLADGMDAARQALAIDKRDLSAHRALVDCTRLSGDEAAADAEYLQKKASNDPESKALLAIRDIGGSKVAGSEDALVSVTKAMPGFVRAGYWLGLAREKKGDKQAAAEAMKAVLIRAPRHEGAKNWLEAQRRAEQRRQEPAMAAAADTAAAAKQAELRPTAAGTDGAKGMTVADSAKAPVAKDAPNAVTGGTKADRGVATPGADGGQAEASKPATKVAGQPADGSAEKPAAGKAAEKVTEPLEPEPTPDVKALLVQAKKLLEKDKSDKVVLLCEKILKLQPKNVEALYDRGVALYNLERYDESVLSLKAALASRPKMSEAMLVLGEAYKMKGLTTEAIRWYRLVLKSAPADADASAARASLQALTGKL